jgi:hypothetical protein
MERMISCIEANSLKSERAEGARRHIIPGVLTKTLRLTSMTTIAYAE